MLVTGHWMNSRLEVNTYGQSPEDILHLQQHLLLPSLPEYAEGPAHPLPVPSPGQLIGGGGQEQEGGQADGSLQAGEAGAGELPACQAQQVGQEDTTGQLRTYKSYFNSCMFERPVACQMTKLEQIKA